MLKKIITSTILLTSIFLGVNNAFAAEDFNIINNTGEIEVMEDSIFVGNVDKHTSVIDLFETLSINDESVNDDIMNAIDVRYVTPEEVDYKVDSDLDIIDQNSKVYVLFKTEADDGYIEEGVENNVEFTLKNLELEEIGTVSELEDNSYNVLYTAVYDQIETEEPVEVENPVEEPILEEPTVDNTILEENETGIYENTTLIIITLLSIIMLIALPKIKINK